MSEDLRVTDWVTIPAWELEFSTSRSSGPGGQHANKTSSRVTLRWHVERSSAVTRAQKDRIHRRCAQRMDANGYLVVHVETHRSQARNKEDARLRLVELLVKGLVVPKSRRATRPSRRSRAKRLDSKKQQSDKKKQRRRPAFDD